MKKTGFEMRHDVENRWPALMCAGGSCFAVGFCCRNPRKHGRPAAERPRAGEGSLKTSSRSRQTLSFRPAGTAGRGGAHPQTTRGCRRTAEPPLSPSWPRRGGRRWPAGCYRPVASGCPGEPGGPGGARWPLRRGRAASAPWRSAACPRPRRGNPSLPPPAGVWGGGSRSTPGGLQVAQLLCKRVSRRYEPAYLA